MNENTPSDRLFRALVGEHAVEKAAMIPPSTDEMIQMAETLQHDSICRVSMITDDGCTCRLAERQAALRHGAQALILARDLEMELRREWWVNHGCPVHAMYGDDGEMQCHGFDFKRQPLDVLRDTVRTRRQEQWAKALTEHQAALLAHPPEGT